MVGICCDKAGDVIRGILISAAVVCVVPET